MMLHSRTREAHSQAQEQRSPRAAVLQNNTGARNQRFTKTLDQKDEHMYHTVASISAERSTMATGMNQLDPRELYRVKKQQQYNSLMAKGVQGRTGRNDAVFKGSASSQQPIAYLMNRNKPVNSIFGSGRSSQRNQGHQLTSLKMSPGVSRHQQNRPPQTTQQLLDQYNKNSLEKNTINSAGVSPARTSLPRERRKESSLNPLNVGGAGNKFNQTLMSFQNRKASQFGTKLQQLPAVRNPQANQTMSNFKTTQEELDFVQSSFRRSIAEQRKSSEEAESTRQERSGRKEIATLRNLDPLKHRHRGAELPDQQGEMQVVTGVDDCQPKFVANSSPAMAKHRQDTALNPLYSTNKAAGRQNMLLPGGQSMSKSKHRTNQHFTPQELPHQQKRSNAAAAANNQNDVPMESAQFDLINQQSRNSSRLTTDRNEQADKNNVLQQYVNRPVVRAGAANPQMSSIRVNPLYGTQGRGTGVSSRITEEKGSSQMPESGTQSKNLSRLSPRQRITINDTYDDFANTEHLRTQETPNAQDNSFLKKRFESVDEGQLNGTAMTFDVNQQVRQVTPPGVNCHKLNTNQVPAVLAKKSSRTTVQRKTSNKAPLHASNSFISGKVPTTSRKPVQKLNSFNSDLREVVAVNEFKNHRNNSRKNSAKGTTKERPRSTLQIESTVTEDWPLNLTSRLNPETQQADFKNVSIQEQSDVAYHVGELLVSKETLPPSRHGEENLASRETFQQQIQTSTPHNLEIKTKSRLQNKMSIITPPSNEHTPDRKQEGGNMYDKYSYRSPNNAHFKASEPKKLLMSTHTLAMSQIDGKEAAVHQFAKPTGGSGQNHSPQKPSLPQVNKPSANNAARRQESPTKFVQQHDISQNQPMIIQAHQLEKRKAPVPNQTLQNFSNRKLTLEERTLKKIAQLKENNSIIIDCNALVGDQQQAAQKNGRASPNYEALKTQDDDNRSMMTYISEVKDNPDNIQTEVRMSKKLSPRILETNKDEITVSGFKQVLQQPADKSQQQKPKSYPLGNPLQTSQLLPQKARAQTNRNIKEVNGKETAIGVGSVVLHLRKNRQHVNGEQVSSKDNIENGVGSIKYLPATLHSDGEGDLDLASRGTRELGTDQMTSGEQLLNSQGMSSPRSTGGPQQFINSVSARADRQSKLSTTQPQAMVKNGKVLRQKAFTNIVRGKNGAGKLQNKLASPRLGTTTANPNSRAIQQQQQQQQQKSLTNKKNKPGQRLATESGFGMDQLELVGTQKEKVSQLPRLPKYDVKKTKYQNGRGGSYQPPRASFIIPHYFGGQHVGFQHYNQTDNFGETLQQTQMHQIITLQNGQVIIKRIDVAFTPNNQININFEQQQQNQPSQNGYVQGGDGQGTNVTPMLSNRDFTYSPVTRLGLKSPSNDGETPHMPGYPAENSSSPLTLHYSQHAASPPPPQKQARQVLELPVNYQPNMRENSHDIIDTVCGTDKSNTSLIKSNDSPHSTLPTNLIMNAAQYASGVPTGQGLTIIKPQSTVQELTQNDSSSASRVVSQNEQYKSDNIYQSVSRQFRPARKHVTQKVSTLLQDTNKSGEILWRENPDETLMVSPEYVLSQQINPSSMKRNEMASSQQPQSYLAFNTHSNLNKSDGPLAGIIPPDDQVSYNYLLAADVHHLQTMDERISENDESALGHHQALSPSLAHLKFIPSAQMTNAQLVVNTQRSNEAQFQYSSAAYSGGLSPGRKQIIFNKQSPKQSNVLLQKSTGSQDFEEHQTLKEAKLQQQNWKQDTAQEPFQKPAEQDEDPIVAKKKLRSSMHKSLDKDLQPQNPHGFQPWDDKPDACLAVQGHGQKSLKKVSKTNLNASWDSNRNKALPYLKQAVGVRVAGSTSSKDSLEKKGAALGSPYNPLRQSTNSSNKPSNKPIRPRNPAKQIVIDDKAKKSERKKQERAMQEIVFDDSNTPHFRLRGDVTEDKTLEEAARKPMTIPDIPEVASPDFKMSGNSLIDNEAELRQSKAEDRLSAAQKRAMRSSRMAAAAQAEESGGSQSSSLEDLDRVVRVTNQDAYMKSHPKELRALRPSQLKFKNMPDLVQLNTSSYLDEEEDESIKKGTYKYKVVSNVTMNSDKKQEEEKKSSKQALDPASYGLNMGVVRSRDWRGVAPPEGEEVSYISQARLGSYFKK